MLNSYVCILIDTDKLGKTNPENDRLLELLRQCELSSVSEKFVRHNVTVDIIWSLNDEIISDLQLDRMDRLKYDIARKKYGGDQGNSSRNKKNIFNIDLNYVIIIYRCIIEYTAFQNV